MILAEYKQFLNDKRADQRIFNGRAVRLEQEVKNMQQELDDIIEALDVMNAVSVLAQTEYKSIFEEMVTQGLQYVFGNSYTFEMENQIVRNQPETYLYAVIDGERHWLKDGDDELGFGVLDIISLLLRVVCWAIDHRKTEGIFMLDEPLKNLDDARFELVDHMLHELSQTLGVQFIIVTQRHKLAEIGDNSFRVTRSGGISHVENLMVEVKQNVGIVSAPNN